jgi:hypothetical protein
LEGINLISYLFEISDLPKKKVTFLISPKSSFLVENSMYQITRVHKSNLALARQIDLFGFIEVFIADAVGEV